MNKFYLIALAATGMLTTSCRDFDQFDDHAVIQHEYNREFTKVFGDVDPTHTWNTAAQRSMDFTINVPGTFNLRVFTTNPKNESTKSELLANYTNNGEGYESGDTYSITFDCPAGLQKVWADIQYVGSERHIIQQVVLDEDGHGKAMFGDEGVTTRATIDPTNNNDVVKKTGKKEIFTLQAYTGINDASAGNKGFIDVIPENVHNVSKEDVHTDFVYVSSGKPYHLYPIYIYTGATVTVGVQYRHDAEADWDSQEITMLTTSPNNGDRVTRLFSTEGSGRTSISETSPYPEAPADFFNGILYNGNNTTNALYYDGGQNDNRSGAKYATIYQDVSGFVGTLCDEIELNIPAGYEFRFWVEQHLNDGRSFKRYSDKESNPDKQIYFGTFNNEHKHNGSPVLYLGLEDWTNTNHDINDIVFAFVGEIPKIIDEGGPHYLDAEYVIAYEDMGTNDFDFNDIVIGVQHVSGETTASVNILACGGTLPVYLGFDDSGETLNPVCGSGGEISLFGGEELHKVLSNGTADSYHTPMNVSGDLRRVVNRSALQYTPKKVTFTVPEVFSIVDKAKFFKLKVNQKPEEGNTITNTITTPDSSKDIFTTPQAFVVSYTGWEWPTENTLITDVYDDFTDWVTNHKGVDGYAWYKPVWSGLDDFSSNVDYSTTLRPSYSFDICLRTREEIEGYHTEANNDVVTVDIPYSVLVNHNLQTYQSLVMAFVVTNRQPGQQPTVKVYKNEVNEANNLGSIEFCDASTTSTTSSYGDADKLSNVMLGELSSTDVIKVVFNRNSRDENANDKKCHLNSIWASRPDNNVNMLDYEDIIGYTEDCTITDHHHTSDCVIGENGKCSNESHHTQHIVVGKLAKVGDCIDVVIVNASTTRPNFLVCNAPRIQHQHSISSMISNAQAIATSTNEDQKSARFRLTVTAMDGDCPVVSIYNVTKTKYLKKDNTSAVWSDACDTTFKICRGTGGSRTSCIPGWNDDDMFRFQAVGTNYYFNVDGPQFKTGNGEWSLWYMFEIVSNK